MKSISKAYASFGELVSDKSYLLRPGLSFEGICKHIGVSPVDLSEIIKQELGMSGTELFQALKRIEQTALKQTV